MLHSYQVVYYIKELYILNALQHEIPSLKDYHTRDLVSGIAFLLIHHLSSSSWSEQSTLPEFEADRALRFGTF
jgi:hypothetical protein